jgi:hypothetical protein
VAVLLGGLSGAAVVVARFPAERKRVLTDRRRPLYEVSAGVLSESANTISVLSSSAVIGSPNSSGLKGRLAEIGAPPMPDLDLTTKDGYDFGLQMGRAGLEPATLGLKVPCSTS